MRTELDDGSRNRRVGTWPLASLARVRRCIAARLTILLLCLVDPAFIDVRAVAQEMGGRSGSRMAANGTVLTLEQEQTTAAEQGSDFKECASGCPIMIVIPAGKFTMGSPENEPDREATEGPRHEVAVAEPFAVSKFEVTFEEWDACVAAARCPGVPDHWGRGRMPVTNVRWGDAKQYF